ncbi:hypothetical protein RUMCAL_02303 [Ruminococcus callidus ATCC 27760]|uniref:Uncharacterized protein n=1 Tax=Ruminococcus callidus ATCC 27760 TaxID=411473 RepID=U2KLT1_9FIRM|nr:hypothetical protein RUMCAL_02303 [Ruminococcus callidus ATCC 27760]
MESSAWCKRVYRSTPQSSLRLASSPKGEPMHKRESLNKNQPPL